MICGVPIAPAQSMISSANWRSKLAAALDLDADGALALQQNALGRAVSLDVQIGPVARLRQVGHSSALAHAVNVVEWIRAYTGRVRLIGVRAIRESGLPAGVNPGPLFRPPILFRIAAHADGAGVAVVACRAEFMVVFQLAKVREYLFEIPAVVAERDPGIEILRYAAQKDLRVDRAGAAHQLAARDRHVSAVRGGLACIPPVVA